MNQKVSVVCIYLLGIIYFVFGLNGFLQFIPAPQDPMPEAATALMNGFIATKYMFPFIKGTEVLGGLMLLTGFARPLGLIILAPITLNIFLFHGLLTPGIQFIILPIIMIVMHIISSIKYKNIYSQLFQRI